MAKVKLEQYKHKGVVHLEQYHFICPGCLSLHAIGKNIHIFNNDFDKPTFMPSLLCTWAQFEVPNDPNTNPVDMRCHSYIKDGRIQFLSDCTHKLANQTVDLFDIVVRKGQLRIPKNYGK